MVRTVRKHKRSTGDIIIAVVLSVLAFGSLVPVWNAICVSLSDRVSASLGYVTIWPIHFNISSYREIFSTDRYFRAFFISIVRVVLGVSLNLGMTIIMAYPMSKSKRTFPWRDVYMWLFVFLMLFGGGLIPSYLVVRNLGLLDTIWALILPSAVSIGNMILMMNFFKGIPSSLEEAALIDGAEPVYILFKIYVPLSTACIATITLFSIVGHWNSFFDGMIYINNARNVPLQTYIQSLNVVIDPNALANMDPEEVARKLEVSSITFNAAKIVVSMIPILLIYPLLQRYFVKGIVLGAVKE